MTTKTEYRAVQNQHGVALLLHRMSKRTHFFDASTMYFFDSKIEVPLFTNETDCLFVTSERFNKQSPRLYSVRKYVHDTGDISTVGQFQQYKTLKRALRAINIAIKEIESQEAV